MVLDDKLQILPISTLTKEIKPLPFSAAEVKATPNELFLKEVKEESKGVKPMGPILNICKTLDQVN